MEGIPERVSACLLYTSVKALLEHDEQLRKKTFDIDAQIDQKERDIEGMCLKLLLSQQPVARDLRMISSALKMISDMELSLIHI